MGSSLPVRINNALARGRTAERMAEAQRTIPAFHVWRQALAEGLQAKGPIAGTTVTARLLPVLASWLIRHPDLNAHYEDAVLTRIEEVNLGLALSHDENVLVVPTLRDCAGWSVEMFAKEVAGLRERSRSNSFRMTDFTAASFTVSNLGAFGVDGFTSIISPPQVAILSVGALAVRPVVADGQVVARRTLPLTLGADHRAVDGVYAARALADLVAEIGSLMS